MAASYLSFRGLLDLRDYLTAHPGLVVSAVKRDNANHQWVAYFDLPVGSGGGPPDPHALGGASHTPDSLANLNARVTDAVLDDVGDPRDPSTHAGNHSEGAADSVTVEDLASAGAEGQVPVAQGDGTVGLEYPTALVQELKVAAGKSVVDNQAVEVVADDAVAPIDLFASEKDMPAGTILRYPAVAHVTDTKVAVVYYNSTNFVYRVGDRVNKTVTWGNEGLVVAGSVSYVRMVDMEHNLLAVTYVRSARCYARMGAVSGTTITWGPEFVVNPSNTQYTHMKHVPGTEAVLLVYRDSGNSGYPTARLLHHDAGSPPSFSGGPETVIDTVAGYYLHVACFSDTKAVMAYRPQSPAGIYSYVLDLDLGGPTITPNAAQATGATGFATPYSLVRVDSTRCVVSYNLTGGRSMLGTLSGASMVWETPVMFDGVNSYEAHGDVQGDYVYLIYRAGNKGLWVRGDISGTALSYCEDYRGQFAYNYTYAEFAPLGTTHYVIAHSLSGENYKGEYGCGPLRNTQAVGVARNAAGAGDPVRLTVRGRHPGLVGIVAGILYGVDPETGLLASGGVAALSAGRGKALGVNPREVVI